MLSHTVFLDIVRKIYHASFSPEASSREAPEKTACLFVPAFLASYQQSRVPLSAKASFPLSFSSLSQSLLLLRGPKTTSQRSLRTAHRLRPNFRPPPLSSADGQQHPAVRFDDYTRRHPATALLALRGRPTSSPLETQTRLRRTAHVANKLAQ